jgi:hypothetical protein
MPTSVCPPFVRHPPDWRERLIWTWAPYFTLQFGLNFQILALNGNLELVIPVLSDSAPIVRYSRQSFLLESK